MRAQSSSRFFIAGCQRSGTTLTRLALECHPQIFCFDELSSYDHLADGAEDPSSVTRVGFKIPRWTEDIVRSGSDGVVDFYHGETILFLLRDPLDSVASMMTLKLGGPSWMEVWGQTILKEKIETDSTFRQRYASEIEMLREEGESLAAAGGLYWLYKTNCCFDLLDRDYPVVPLRYESLVTAPRQQLQGVLEALDLPWDDATLSHPSFPHTEVFSDGRTVGSCDPNRAIDTSSVERGKRFFSQEDAATILRMTERVDPRYHSRDLDRRSA